MSAPTIAVKNLHKSFSHAKVLAGVDLIIQPSKINFIIGQSGGGKSVLLKHLVGLIAPDEGEIWYDGQQMVGAGNQKWAQLRLSLALLFQNGALFDSMSVEENVAFPLWIHQKASLRQASGIAREKLKELGLGSDFDQRPANLSAGERKRVALARALIMEPDILFFDEPTTGLDPLLSEQVNDLIMLTLHRTEATVVVVSHDIPGTLTLAHNVSMIYDGRIILSGSPEEFRQSENPVIKQFLAGEADGPMGFLD